MNSISGCFRSLLPATAEVLLPFPHGGAYLVGDFNGLRDLRRPATQWGKILTGVPCWIRRTRRDLVTPYSF